MIKGGKSLVSSPPVFSNDAKKLLVCTGCTVSIFSTSTSLQITELEGHTALVTSVVVVPAFTPSSKILCYCWTSSLDGTVRYWDFSLPELMKTVDIRLPIFSMVIPGILSQLAETDGKTPNLFAYLSVENTKIQDDQPKVHRKILKCNLTKSRLAAGVILAETQQPELITISSSGKFFGVRNKRKLHVWEVIAHDHEGAPIKKITLHHTKNLTVFAFHPTERIVAAGDVTGRILIWRSFGRRTFSMGDGLMNGRAMNNEDERPGVRGDDDADSCATWHWHSAEVKVLSFSSDGAYLFSGGKEGVLVFWQLDTGKKKFLPRIGSPLLYFTTSLDPSLSSVSCADNRIHLLKMPSMEILKSISGIKLPCSFPEIYEGLHSRFIFDQTAGLVAFRTENYCIQFYSLFDDRENFGNKFVAIGSGVFAFITQSPSKNYSTGCASLEGETLRYCSPKSGCSGPGSGKNFPLSSTEYSGIAQDSLPAKGYPGNPNNPYQDNLPYRRGPYTEIISESSSICYGIYCCETAFPKDLTSFNMQLNTMQTTGFKSETEDICGYAFIAQTNFPVSYTISSSRKIVPVSEVVPAVLEWTVGNISCHEAKGREDYACGYNSSCVDSTQGSGYKCKCLIGYRGNPYLPTGCEDVDECKEPKNNICHEIARCVNIPGNYSCICPDGYHGDATKFGSGCIPVKGKLPVPLVVSLGIGIAVGLLILLAIAFWLYKRLEKRKKDILKRKFFDENGGRLLRHMMALSKGSVEKMKLYIIEELEKATDNFNVNRILGKGGFGTVYKGMLQDGSIVAVKKSDKVDEMQVDQFVNEVFILTQIDHSHIVKLLGCCLETEVPLLVYEHVSNGTLSHHLHDKGHLSTLSWENRLRIASEIADALDYLHSYGSAAIFHRDIKSNNILLDENLRAIVADFGISRPVSAKKTHLTASVLQGTYGYLDPEYFQTWQFTSKSDVYAFGVLLAELITGEKAICADRDKQGLASHFTSAMKSNDLFEIVDHTLVLNEDQKEEILVVARIAERCLEPTGDKRPTMKDVAGGLPKLRKIFLEQQVVE